MEVKAKAQGFIKLIKDEVSHDIRKPNMAEQIELEEAVKKAETEKKSILVSMVDWIEKLGLKREVALSIDQETFLELVSALSGSKKNV